MPDFVHGSIDLYDCGECFTDQVRQVFGHLVANELTKSVGARTYLINLFIMDTLLKESTKHDNNCELLKQQRRDSETITASGFEARICMFQYSILDPAIN